MRYAKQYPKLKLWKYKESFRIGFSIEAIGKYCKWAICLDASALINSLNVSKKWYFERWGNAKISKHECRVMFTESN